MTPELAPSPFLFPSPTLYPGETITPGGPFTALLWDAFAPFLANDTTGDLANYLTSIGTMLDTVAGIVSDQGSVGEPGYVPGWSNLLDPVNCPDDFLPFLAQFNGTIVQPGADPTMARATILAEAGFARGTFAAIVMTAQQYLTGTQSCFLLERTKNTPGDDAYYFLLIVRPEELSDVNALINAVDSVKPAGIQWTLVQTDGFTWAEAIHTWNADTFPWNAADTTQP